MKQNFYLSYLLYPLRWGWFTRCSHLSHLEPIFYLSLYLSPHPHFSFLPLSNKLQKLTLLPHVHKYGRTTIPWSMNEYEWRMLLRLYNLEYLSMYYMILHHQFPFPSRLGRDEMRHHRKMEFTRHSSIIARETKPCRRSPPNRTKDQDTNNTDHRLRTRHSEAPNPHTTTTQTTDNNCNDGTAAKIWALPRI